MVANFIMANTSSNQCYNFHLELESGNAALNQTLYNPQVDVISICATFILLFLLLVALTLYILRSPDPVLMIMDCMDEGLIGTELKSKLYKSGDVPVYECRWTNLSTHFLIHESAQKRPKCPVIHSSNWIFNKEEITNVPEFIRETEVKEHMWNYFSADEMLSRVPSFSKSFNERLLSHAGKLVLLEDVEGLMMDLMVALLFGKKNIIPDEKYLKEQIDIIHTAKEFLWKFPFKMTLINIVKFGTRIHPELCKLLVARKEAVKKLLTLAQALGEEELENWMKDLFPEIARLEFYLDALTSLERGKFDTVIEVLQMAKKKLGSLMFDALYNIGQDLVWQDTLKTDMKRMLYTDRKPLEEYLDVSPCLEATYLESLRLSKRSFSWGIRLLETPIHDVILQDGEEFPHEKNTIILPCRRHCDDFAKNWGNRLDNFAPDYWLLNSDDRDGSTEPMVDLELYNHMEAFGNGSLECPGQGLVQTVMFHFIGLITTLYHIESGKSKNESKKYIIFQPRPDGEIYDPIYEHYATYRDYMLDVKKINETIEGRKKLRIYKRVAPPSSGVTSGQVHLSSENSDSTCEKTGEQNDDVMDRKDDSQISTVGSTSAASQEIQATNCDQSIQSPELINVDSSEQSGSARAETAQSIEAQRMETWIKSLKSEDSCQSVFNRKRLEKRPKVSSECFDPPMECIEMMLLGSAGAKSRGIEEPITHS